MRFADSATRCEAPRRIDPRGAARRNRQASIAIGIRTSGAAANATRSSGPTPKSTLCIRRVSAAAASRPSDEAERRGAEPFANHQPHQIRLRRAERGADAELAPPLRHVVRQHAVEADRRQRQRERSQTSPAPSSQSAADRPTRRRAATAARSRSRPRASVVARRARTAGASDDGAPRGSDHELEARSRTAALVPATTYMSGCGLRSFPSFSTLATMPTISTAAVAGRRSAARIDSRAAAAADTAARIPRSRPTRACRSTISASTNSRPWRTRRPSAS